MSRPDHQRIATDVLIIGAGGAGLRAAIEAANKGLDVRLLCKEVLGCAHTGMAMGGMNAAMRKPATRKQHFIDTMEGGWRFNDPDLVRAFAYEMPERIYDLESYGVLYDRESNGEFYVWKGGKQTESLNVCIGDYTGREMMQALVDQVRKSSIAYHDEFFVTKLLTVNHEVVGVIGIDLKTGAFIEFCAKAVILATGGAGRMYQVTTNAASNTGDGYAMALDVGAELVDIEMVQFHPTGMVFPESARGLLVTEKVRGHGGQLFNTKGERFLTRYYPEKMELAGRDEIARAIYQEVRQGRGTENGGVYLKVTHWSKGEVEDKIPDVFEQYLATGVDIRKEPMEVYPTMHHMCGGVRINVDGETNVSGLLAVGEVTGGIHGANRLGGNSIAEGQVFGKRCIKAAQKLTKLRKRFLPIQQSQVDDELDRIVSLLSKNTGVNTYALEEELKKAMWNDVGIVRNEKGLMHAKSTVHGLKKRLSKIKTKVRNPVRNKELQDALELANMLETAAAVIETALERKESRGAHSRTDYPKDDPKLFKNLMIKKVGDRFQTTFQAIKKYKS